MICSLEPYEQRIGYFEEYINLATTTWNTSGGGKYYIWLNTTIPTGAKVIGWAIYNWDNMPASTDFDVCQGYSQPTKCGLLSSKNSFPTGCGLYVRVTYIMQ